MNIAALALWKRIYPNKVKTVYTLKLLQKVFQLKKLIQTHFYKYKFKETTFRHWSFQWLNEQLQSDTDRIQVGRNISYKEADVKLVASTPFRTVMTLCIHIS